LEPLTRGPHGSTTPQDRESRVEAEVDSSVLNVGEDCGEAEVTIVLVLTSYTYPCPSLNRYHTLARATTCMVDGGAPVVVH
jgi:hypothetical protein